MEEARLGPDDLRKMGQEGDDVVLDLALDRIDALDVEHPVAPLLPHFGGGLPRDDAELRERVRGVGLDLEPDAKPRLRFPDRGHDRPTVAGDHSTPPSDRPAMFAGPSIDHPPSGAGGGKRLRERSAMARR
jgi:hypothetical protein